LNEAEVAINHIADKPCAVLVLGFESADHPVEHWIKRAVEIACDNGGTLSKGGIVHNTRHIDTRENEAESWRNAFIRMPYWRNRLSAFGIVADAFETSVIWDRFPDFYRLIKQEMEKAIRDITGHPYSFSCRFTHVYPDGPAPYFTFYAVGDAQGNFHNAIDKWKRIKLAAMQLLADNGATVTHHHAVGRDHRPGYEQQTSPLFRQTLAAGKAFLDPSALLNPGVLFDPAGKNVGITGVLGNTGNDRVVLQS
jgi:alkyldihydroxyacetonephosphate synthase